MDGTRLKQLLIPLDDSLANIARKLGMSPQSLDNMFNNKDIKSGFIERIAKLYNKPISYFFDENDSDFEISAKNHSGASGTGNVLILNETAPIHDIKMSKLIKENEDLRSEFERLKINYDWLNKLIEQKDHTIEEKERTISEMERTISVLNLFIDTNKK